MNKKRREKIAKIIMELQNSEQKLTDILTEEEIVFDSMPENLQGSMRGDESQEAISILEDSIEKIQNICIELECI